MILYDPDGYRSLRKLWRMKVNVILKLIFSRFNKENTAGYNLLKYIYGLGYRDNQTRGIKLEKDVTVALYIYMYNIE